MWSFPTWWNHRVNFGGTGDMLKVFSLNTTTGQLSTTPTSQTSNQTSNVFPYPGTTTSVSSDQNSNAIVWARDNSSFETTTGAVLYA